ncbi:hypothetical protein Tco_0105487 [Tanacetum coccineum]
MAILLLRAAAIRSGAGILYRPSHGIVRAIARLSGSSKFSALLFGAVASLPDLCGFWSLWALATASSALGQGFSSPFFCLFWSSSSRTGSGRLRLLPHPFRQA